MAQTRRRQLAELGNKVATYLRRLISLFSRSQLQAVGSAHAYSVFWWQAKHRKALGQIYLGPGRQFGMRAAPALYCQAQSAIGFVHIWRLEDGADRACHRDSAVELGDITLSVVLQVKLAALPDHTGKHGLARSLESSMVRL